MNLEFLEVRKNLSTLTALSTPKGQKSWL